MSWQGKPSVACPTIFCHPPNVVARKSGCGTGHLFFEEHIFISIFWNNKDKLKTTSN